MAQSALRGVGHPKEGNAKTVLPDALVTWNDDRGMSTLLAMLGTASPARAAADAILGVDERVVVCTGFPVSGASETDGPAGAVALAGALRTLGKDVAVASWPEALAAWGPVLGDLPTLSVAQGGPSPSLGGVAVTIEVCGRLEDGSYRTMRGVDIRASAPWFEDALAGHALVSIGDGGNEFGMGSAPREWFAIRQAARPVSTCDVLVVGQVSNWAALAVVAAIGRASGRDLLPSGDGYVAILERLAKRGVVDGVRGAPQASEDGFDPSNARLVLDRLRQWSTA